MAWTVRVGEDGGASRQTSATSTTTARLSPEDFIVLAGGRRKPEATQPKIEGDEDLGHQLMRSMAVTP